MPPDLSPVHPSNIMFFLSFKNTKTKRHRKDLEYDSCWPSSPGHGASPGVDSPAFLSTPNPPITRLVLEFPELCLTCSKLESSVEENTLFDQLGPLPYALASLWATEKVCFQDKQMCKRDRTARVCLTQLPMNRTTLKPPSLLFVLWNRKELAALCSVLLRRK